MGIYCPTPRKMFCPSFLLGCFLYLTSEHGIGCMVSLSQLRFLVSCSQGPHYIFFCWGKGAGDNGFCLILPLYFYISAFSIVFLLSTERGWWLNRWLCCFVSYGPMTCLSLLFCGSKQFDSHRVFGSISDSQVFYFSGCNEDGWEAG